MKLFPADLKGWLKASRWFLIPVMLFAAFGCFSMMPGKSYSGSLTPLSADDRVLATNLFRHVSSLAKAEGRNIQNYSALEKSADYIEQQFNANGVKVQRQDFIVDSKLVCNIEVEIGSGKKEDGIIIVGAHYDTCGITPGANDNASGTAGVIELARLLKDRPLKKRVRLVAFVNEEPPYFITTNMGSRVYARKLKNDGEKVLTMMSLETIGYYSDVKGSQKYPAVFSLFYPDRGNFVGFVGGLRSRKQIREAVKIFRDSTKFPSEGVSAPGWIKGIGWSDHWSFWMEGYPGLMVTDTAFFRYDQYHTTEDTPEKLDYGNMARILTGIVKIVERLAE